MNSWRKALNDDNFFTEFRTKAEIHAQFAAATQILFRLGDAGGFATFCTSFVDKIVRKNFDTSKEP